MINNILPSSLRPYLDQIERIVSTWPIQISLDHTIKWILQFDAEDYLLAIRILQNIDVFGVNEVRSSLEVAHTKLNRKISEKGKPIKGNNTLYAAIGNSAKSGALIAYHYRVTADIAEDDFFSDEETNQLNWDNIENVVFVDDVIGTGKTISKEITQIAEEIYTLAHTRNIFVLTVAGYEDGIQRIIDETGASVVCALEYTSKDTVSNLDGRFFNGLPMSERLGIQDRIKRYCKSISRSELGFGGVGGLLVFDHNTPNTTLPIIWHDGKGWLPLFQRSKKITGAAKVLKSAKEEREKTLKSENQTKAIKREESELTLFVEGKIDEIFVDYMRQKCELAKHINVGEITTIALGGLHQSSRLLDLLTEIKKHVVFIVDNDEFSQRAIDRIKTSTDIHYLHLKPSFVAMLDIEKLYLNREQFPRLPENIGSLDDIRWLHQVEMAVLKRFPIHTNSERIIQIIDEYLNIEKYEEFVVELKIIVDKIFKSAT